MTAPSPVRKVGFMAGGFLDDSRPNWDGSGPRPIEYAVWHPAGNDASEREALIGPPGEELMSIGPLARGAAPALEGRPFPVVAMSHGTGGAARGMGWLGRRMAQRGYVAFAVNHHGNTIEEDAYRAEGFACWWERMPDLNLTLSYLLESETFGGVIDETRAIAAGFSLGGYTVLGLAGAITDVDQFLDWVVETGQGGGPREFPDLSDRIPDLMRDSAVFRESWARNGDRYRDERIRAVYACAPAPTVRGFTEESLSGIDVPVSIIVGQSDLEAPHQDASCWVSDRIPGCGLTLLPVGVGHYVFLPEATDLGRRLMPEICTDPPGVDRSHIHDLAAEEADGLFKAALSEQ